MIQRKKQPSFPVVAAFLVLGLITIVLVCGMSGAKEQAQVYTILTMVTFILLAGAVGAPGFLRAWKAGRSYAAGIWIFFGCVVVAFVCAFGSNWLLRLANAG